MLGVAQKLTKLDIPLETSVAWDSGSGSQKMPCPAVPNLLLFTFLWDFQSSLDKSRENSSKMPKRQNSGNTSVKVVETPAGNQQRETVHGPPFYVADFFQHKELSAKKKLDHRWRISDDGVLVLNELESVAERKRVFVRKESCQKCFR